MTGLLEDVVRGAHPPPQGQGERYHGGYGNPEKQPTVKGTKSGGSSSQAPQQCQQKARRPRQDPDWHTYYFHQGPDGEIATTIVQRHLPNKQHTDYSNQNH